MATLLIVGNSEGSRRCDAKCHDAGESECDCVCGGRYHGRGTAGARELIQRDIAGGRFGAELAHIAQHLTFEALQEDLFERSDP
jgi:hypothetical protein